MRTTRKRTARARLVEVLRRFHAETAPDAPRRLESDPLQVARGYAAPADREVAALVASSLAYGNAKAARASARAALSRCGPRGPAAFARDFRPARGAAGPFAGFRHRFTGPLEIAALFAGVGELLERDGRLGGTFARAWADSGHDLAEALARWRDAIVHGARARRLRGGAAPSRGLEHLMPDPRKKSTCKRLLLFLRWVVRPDDGVDLGLWPEVPARALLVPLDVHLVRIARNLALTERRSAGWAMAEEVTARLREVDPDDPVKLDFALCHLGISRACPSRRDVVKCEACKIRHACVRWDAPG